MANSYNKFCNGLVYLLKLLIYFDTYQIQSGGAGAAVAVVKAAAPGAAAAVAGAAPVVPLPLVPLRLCTII